MGPRELVFGAWHPTFIRASYNPFQPSIQGQVEPKWDPYSIVTPPTMSLDEQPNPSTQLTPPAPTNFVAAAAPAAPEGQPSVIRQYLQARGSGGLADKAFAGLMLLCALSIFAIVLFILCDSD